MTAVKTAVVGFGLSGAVFHAPFIEASGRFELTAIVQRNGHEAAKSYPAARIYRSFEEMLGDESIELVVVCTPNSLHYPMARAALLAGKHVVVDKPFAPSSRECWELIELAEQQGCRLFVFYNRRWDSDFLTVRQVVDSGSLGQLLSYEAHFDRFAPALNRRGWKEEKSPGISVLHDLGTHIIDQAVCLFGSPQAVTGHLVTQRERSVVSDGFDIRLEYPSLYVKLRSSLLVVEQGPRYVVNGRKGAFVKYGIDPQEADMLNGKRPCDPGWGEEPENDWGVLITVDGSGKNKKTVPTIPGNYMGFYDNVAGVLRDGAKIAISPEEALVAVKIIEAVLVSDREKRTVLL